MIAIGAKITQEKGNSTAEGFSSRITLNFFRPS